MEAIRSLQKGQTITYSGVAFDYANPSPKSIFIEDIAHALSRTGRFGGHIDEFLTVAEHSVNVSKRVMAAGGTIREVLDALLHDASEAYICDIPSPVKSMMKDYLDIETKVMNAVGEAYGVDWPVPNIVNEADKAELEREMRVHVVKEAESNPPLPMNEAKNLFLGMYEEITGESMEEAKEEEGKLDIDFKIRDQEINDVYRHLEQWKKIKEEKGET